MLRRFLLACLLTPLLLARPAWALNGGLMEVAHGDGLDRVQIAVIEKMGRRMEPMAGWNLVGHWEAGLGFIERRNGKSAASAHLTPVVRFRPNGAASTQPYLEGGIGVHLLTQDRLDDAHDFGAHALLSELIGMGVTFGDRSQYDLGYRLNNLGTPNSKNATLHSVRLIYAY